MYKIEKIYISEKEAAERYSYSRAWFQRTRWLGGNSGPKYLKVRGKILYNLSETDRWFADHGVRSSTSEGKGDV